MKEIIIGGLLLFYVIYTARFAIKFHKTNKYYSGRQLLVHNICIWVVPFLWVLMLKTILKPTPKYTDIKNKRPDSDSPFHDYTGINYDSSSDFGHSGDVHH